MQKHTLRAVLFGVLLGFGACTEAVSPRARSLAVVNDSDFQQVAAGQRAFSFDLYRAVAGRAEQGFVVSPYSIDVALSMAYAGAKSGTASALEAALKSGLVGERHHRATNQLDREVTSRTAGPSPASELPFRLDTANSLFVQRGLPLHQPFLDTLAVEYGAGVRLEDFAANAETARQNVNRWVASKTAGQIDELLAPGTVNASTPLVLVNAITFASAWATPFSRDATWPQPFVDLQGVEHHVPTMGVTASFATAQLDGAEVIRLPYVAEGLGMLVMMPRAGDFERFERTLDERRLETIEGALTSERITLSVPKFALRSPLRLREPLTQVGLGALFAGSDFSGIGPNFESIAVGDVIHEAVIEFDERGTEASAATAVVFDGGVAAPLPARVVKVNRPFIFALTDFNTGAVLFVGRVMTPTSSVER